MDDLERPPTGEHALHRIEIAELEHLLHDAFAGVGLGGAEAARIADSLVQSELEDVPTHGVMRVPWYLDGYRTGRYVPAGDLAVERCGAVGVLDGGGALGYLPTSVAVDAAVGLAAEQGIGAVGVHRIAEFGRAAYYTQAAAARGMVAIVCQNTQALLAAPGACSNTIGNNPLAYATPGADGAVFDAAFTPRSGGEVRRRALLGLPLPLEWGYVDADGRPTEDPVAAAAGAPQAVGGAKGFGLAVLVDLLAGPLAGGCPGHRAGMVTAEMGAFVLAIDPARFGAQERMHHEVGEIAAAVRSSGGRWPGDRAKRARDRHLAAGAVEIAEPLWRALVDALA
ncbi:MAG: Ldh family oxidoreductase [Ilumatobacteraceae bacterium]